MHKIRSSKFRKWVLSLFLIAGFFPSIQAAFACEKIDDRIQFTSDCLQIIDSAKSCENMQECLNTTVDINNDCCDSSPHVFATVKNTTQNASFLALLMMDGPQPPPAISSVTLTFNQTSTDPQFFSSQPKHLSSSDIYLKTQRFRI